MITLPADGHVHTQFSYDTLVGDMEESCAQAVRLGLPAIAFTEHYDCVPARYLPHEAEQLPEHFRAVLRPVEGEDLLELVPPPVDVEGYLAAVERCRDRFPDLRVLSGAELGEPHWNGEVYAPIVARAGFDRVLGSLHGLQARGGFTEVAPLLHGDAWAVVRAYLTEMASLAASTADFEVLTHADYPLRYLPPGAPRIALTDLEPEYRAVFDALAPTGRALEVNTRLGASPVLLRWWHEAGGQAVTFGSDAHRPSAVAHGFAEAAAVVEAAGFSPAAQLFAPWRRR